jgi:predicted kinase
MNHTLHLMVGLPRSGKSTAARQLGFPIVEPDAIRRVIHGTHWRENVEPMIWAVARIMVESLFESGHPDVVLDAVNHTEERRRVWHNPAWAVRYHCVDTPVDVCLQRARETGQAYLMPVIERMHRDFEPVGGNMDC